MLIPEFKHWNKVESKKAFGDLKRNYGQRMEEMPKGKGNVHTETKYNAAQMEALRDKWAAMDRRDRQIGVIKLGGLLIVAIVVVFILANFHTILNYLIYPPGFRPGDDVLTPVIK